VEAAAVEAAVGAVVVAEAAVVVAEAAAGAEGAGLEQNGLLRRNSPAAA
jgi:hypothetical protein